MALTRYASFVVVGGSITTVLADVPSNSKLPIEIAADATWPLQNGGRPAALDFLYQRCANYLEAHSVEQVVIKASALSTGPAKLALLESAEARGVVIAAAAAHGKPVSLLTKASISRTYGTRKVDDYVQDESFWSSNLAGGKLRKASREAALLIIASRVH